MAKSCIVLALVSGFPAVTLAAPVAMLDVS